MTAKRYAVLVGASQFPHADALDDLRCPEHDVDDLNDVLSDPARGAFTETDVLKNRPHHVVLRAINQVLRRAEKDDLVLIYYSGHGKLDSAGRLYLAATDTEIETLESTSIPTASIKTYIDVSRTTRIVLVLDCCYSGAVEKDFFRGNVDDQFNIMSGGRGTFIVTASTGIQLAKEKEKDRNGVFTKHLIEGLRSGDADRDGNGYITMDELYRYVHGQVTAESHQEPMKWDANVRGELIVAKSGRTPRKERYTKIRRRLLSLAGRGTIADDLLGDAVKIAAKPGRDLDPRELEYDQLLDDFMAKNLSVGEFVRQWYETPSIRDEAEEEERKHAEAEAKRKAEARRSAEEKEERKHAEAEAKRKAEARRTAEEEERKHAEAEAKRKAEARRTAEEEEERKHAEAEAKRKVEARRKAEAKRMSGNEEAQRAGAKAIPWKRPHKLTVLIVNVFYILSAIAYGFAFFYVADAMVDGRPQKNITGSTIIAVAGLLLPAYFLIKTRRAVWFKNRTRFDLVNRFVMIIASIIGAVVPSFLFVAAIID